MNKVFAAYTSRKEVLEKSSNLYIKGVAWIEGELVSLSEARIPLLDQGFMHRDLTYDVPSVWDGRYFRLDAHLDRLESSCAKMRLQLPLPREQFKDILVDMVAKSEIRDAFVELIVTRGMQDVRGHARGQVFKNNLYMFIKPYVWVMEPETQRTGGTAVITRTVRRTPPGSMDPTIKNLQWGDLTRAIFEATDRGAMYPFLTDGHTNLTEGAGFNIVLVKDGVMYTPGCGVLHGVTRRSVIDVARSLSLEVRVQIVPIDLVYGSDEIFMCTTAGGIMPITELDGQPVKDGKVGPVTKQIWDGYWAIHYDADYSLEIKYDDI